MRDKVRQDSSDGLIRQGQKSRTSKPAPETALPEIPDMDSGEFDAAVAAEWARLALAVRP